MIMLITFAGSNCNFPCLILTPVFLISFYILSKRFFPKCKGLFDARVVSITKKGYGFAVHFYYRFTKSVFDE